MIDHQENTTQILVNLRSGEREAFDRLFPRVYDELRSIARGKLRQAYGNQTLNTSALVHETYLKLVDHAKMDWQNRAHFFSVAARAMRQILVDRSRKKRAQKRGGDRERTLLTNQHLAFEMELENILDLDEALDKLGQLNERQSRVVECRFFGGLTHEETAEVLACSKRTVRRDWKKARLFLHRELHPEISSS